MNKSEDCVRRVLLVDLQGTRSSVLKRALVDNGYELVDRLYDVAQMVEVAVRSQPDLVVLGIDLPDAETIKQLVSLRAVYPLPLIVFAEKDTPQIIQQVVQAGVSAFIVDDIQAQRFPSIINVAVARFKAQQGLLEELETTRTKLAERKLLERAKGLLMEQKGLTEDEAYKSLRKMAMDKGQPIVKVAESIIDVMQMFDGAGRA